MWVVEQKQVSELVVGELKGVGAVPTQEPRWSARQECVVVDKKSVFPASGTVAVGIAAEQVYTAVWELAESE